MVLHPNQNFSNYHFVVFFFPVRLYLLVWVSSTFEHSRLWFSSLILFGVFFLAYFHSYTCSFSSFWSGFIYSDYFVILFLFRLLHRYCMIVIIAPYSLLILSYAFLSSLFHVHCPIIVPNFSRTFLLTFSISTYLIVVFYDCFIIVLDSLLSFYNFFLCFLLHFCSLLKCGAWAVVTSMLTMITDLSYSQNERPVSFPPEAACIFAHFVNDLRYHPSSLDCYYAIKKSPHE